MIESENTLLADKYGLSPSDYEEVEISTLPISVRAINCFKSGGIKTVGELLQRTPPELFRLRNFGTITFHEVEDYLASLAEGKEKPQCSSVHPSDRLKRFATEIACGNFTFFEQYPISVVDKETLDIYRNAYDCLGEELALACVRFPEHVIPLIQMLSNFTKKTTCLSELEQLINFIPLQRRAKNAHTFILAFTSDEKERSILNNVFGEDARLDEIEIERILEIDSEGQKIVKKFLYWCQFDLEKELSNFFDKLLDNERVRAVIRGRAERKTLDEIGMSFGITRERVRQIEAKYKRKFEHQFPRIKLFPKISAELYGATIISPTTLSRFNPHYSKELLFFLKDYRSASFTYDTQLDTFILGDDSVINRVSSIIEGLPEILTAKKVNDILTDAEIIDALPSVCG